MAPITSRVREVIAWKGVRGIVNNGRAGPAPVAPDPLGVRGVV
jgi:hypothetical protein